MGAGEIRKDRLPIGIFAGMTLVAIIGAAIWFGRNSLSVAPVPTSAPFVTRTFTPAITLTPSLTPSLTPLPTATVTPLPAWVTNFADPILAAIANRPPDIQDTFDDNSGGWRQLERYRCGQRVQVLDGELVFTDCGGNRTNMAYSDFVLELDARFPPETKSNQAAWYVQFRDGIYFLSVNTHGLIYFVTDGKERIDLEIPTAAKSGQATNHLLLIAKGAQIAFYLNGAPFYHTNNASYTTQKGFVFGCWGESPTNLNRPCVVAFDNFKIWNTSNVP